MPSVQCGPRLRKAIRVMLVLLLCFYLISYFFISRHSHSMMQRLGGQGFYYVLCEPDRMMRSEGLQRMHVLLSYIYYPIWLFDYNVLGGPPVAHFPLMRVE